MKKTNKISRKPFQGVCNIIKFNWHFYLLTLVFLFVIFIINSFFAHEFKIYFQIIFGFILGTSLISLIVSYLVYDFSDLYQFFWLKAEDNCQKVVNIHAGFDETSLILQEKLNPEVFFVFDFYNPLTHTEISIKRARKAYPPFPNTQTIHTANLPLEDNAVDKIFILFAAHEIRNDEERIIFFKELSRILKSSGKIYVMEHLRDLPNFLAYNIGFLHFFSHKTWRETFFKAGIFIAEEYKTTPFISTFILQKNGFTT